MIPSHCSLSVCILLPVIVAGTLVYGSRCLISRPFICLDKPIHPEDFKITVIIPSLGGGERLSMCLESLAAYLPSNVAKVIVILQQCAADQIRETRDHWCHSAELLFLPMEGNPSKVRAIRLGFTHVKTDLILLIDSDVCATAHIHRILTLCNDQDVAFGMLLPKEVPSQTMLDRVVKADKVVSHAVWRLGRFVLGLWPNIPGQCYLIRSKVLRRVYDGGMGHLDDLSVTVNLAALRARVFMVPVVVGYEVGRCTWMGLLSQRIRWSLGLWQSFCNLLHIKNGMARGAACFLVHTWLYSGWPITTMLLSIYLLCRGQKALACECLFVFIISWTTLVGFGNKVFSRIERTFVKIPIVSSAIPAAFIILISQSLGFMAAPFFVISAIFKPFVFHRLLYKR